MKTHTSILLILITGIFISCNNSKTETNAKEDKYFETKEEALNSIMGKTYPEICDDWGSADSRDHWGRYWKKGVKVKGCYELFVDFSVGAESTQKPRGIRCECEESKKKIYDYYLSQQKNDIVCSASKDGKMTFLNDSSTFVIGSFDYLQDFSDGLASFQQELGDASDRKQANVYGFINGAGEKVIKPIYSDVGNFHEGLCWVRLIYDTPQQYCVRYINKEGKEVFGPICGISTPKDFCNGIVELNGQYYDTKGVKVNAPEKSCRYVPKNLNDSLGLIKTGTQSTIGLEDQGYNDAYGMPVVKRVQISGKSGYRTDKRVVINDEHSFLGNFHYVNGINFIKEFVEVKVDSSNDVGILLAKYEKLSKINPSSYEDMENTRFEAGKIEKILIDKSNQGKFTPEEKKKFEAIKSLFEAGSD